MRIQQMYQKLNTNLKWIIGFIVFNFIAISWVLMIWVLHIESYPNLPFLYKGIKHIPIQFLQMFLYVIDIAIIY